MGHCDFLAFDLIGEPTYVDDPLAKPPKPPANPLTEAAEQLKIPAWGKILIWAFVAAAVCIGGTVIHTEVKLASMDTQVQGLPKSIGDQMDTKLANFKTDMIKEFYKRAKAYTEAGHFDDGAAALRAAAILTSMSSDAKQPADAAFFRHAVVSLRDIEKRFPGPTRIAEPLHHAEVALANYRSVLATPPKYRLVGTPIKGPVTSPLKPGTEFDYVGGAGGWIVPALTPQQIRNPPMFSMENIAWVGKSTGFAQLDGWEMKNVTFSNIVIVYTGGPIILDNVKFIHCSFDVSPNEAGRRLMAYVSLDEPKLRNG